VFVNISTVPPAVSLLQLTFCWLNYGMVHVTACYKTHTAGTGEFTPWYWWRSRGRTRRRSIARLWAICFIVDRRSIKQWSVVYNGIRNKLAMIGATTHIGCHRGLRTDRFLYNVNRETISANNRSQSSLSLSEVIQRRKRLTATL